LVGVRVFVEGGGDRRETLSRCREAFSRLFAKALGAGRRPAVVACGSRNETFKRFCSHVALAEKVCFLLVDAEGPLLAANESVRDLLFRRDGWRQPPGVTDDQLHLMIECMEAWLLADREALVRFYNGDLVLGALPGNPRVEQVPKDDILQGLENATHSSRKGMYHKGRHSFAILASVDAAVLEERAASAARLFVVLRNSLGGDAATA